MSAEIVHAVPPVCRQCKRWYPPTPKPMGIEIGAWTGRTIWVCRNNPMHETIYEDER